MDLLKSGTANRAREVEKMARRSARNNNSTDAQETSTTRRTTVNSPENNVGSPTANIEIDNANEIENRTPAADTSDEMIGERNSTRAKLIIEPINTSDINQKKFTRFKEITLQQLNVENTTEYYKGYLDLQLLRVIANGNSRNQSMVKYYKAKDANKKMNAVAYKRLFLLRVINSDINDVCNDLVYILKDDLHHANLWNAHVNIRDDGTISIGSVIRLFCPKPYENIMPDGVPSIESRFPVAVMKTPSFLPEVRVDNTIKGGKAMAFSLNGCTVEMLQIMPKETGCSGKFCDKQRVLEV